MKSKVIEQVQNTVDQIDELEMQIAHCDRMISELQTIKEHCSGYSRRIKKEQKRCDEMIVDLELARAGAQDLLDIENQKKSDLEKVLHGEALDSVVLMDRPVCVRPRAFNFGGLN